MARAGSALDVSTRHGLLADRSEAIYGHRHVLPVAVWILESGTETMTQPVVSRGLEGRSPPNKVLHALERLGDIGALTQLPFPGRPHARTFEKAASAFWALVAEDAAEVDGTLGMPSNVASRLRRP
jgi:hypothetical protein